MSSSVVDRTLEQSEISALAGRAIASELQPHTHYRLERVIGRGGFAIACLAIRHCAEGTAPVVLKVIRPSLVADARRLAARAFKKESVALGRLNEQIPPTPFVVRLIDTGSVSVMDQGQSVDVPWIALEYVHGGIEGETLARRVRYSLEHTGFAFDAERAAVALQHLVAGISEIHAVSVIHRDLKPSNVLCCGFGRSEIFKISDFGIARPAGVQSTFGDVTLGTAGYVAPEQVHMREEIGPWTDVFSLAAVTYYMLAGQKYFDVRSAVEGVMAAGTEQRPSLLDSKRLTPELARDETACRALDVALRRATSADPRQRTESARAFAASVLPWLSEHPGSGRPSERLVTSVVSSVRQASDDDVAAYRWSVRALPTSDWVIASLDWDGDGRCLAITTAGPQFWNGAAWIASPLAVPGVKVVRRLSPGRWLLVDAAGALHDFRASGVRPVLGPPEGAREIVAFDGDVDDLALAAAVGASGEPLACGLSARRWLKPLPLPDAANVTALARIDDARWLSVGRAKQGGAHAEILSPLRFESQALNAPPDAVLVAAAGQAARGQAVAVGSGGTVLRVLDGGAQLTHVADHSHLSAVALDVLGTCWLGSAGRIWLAPVGKSATVAFDEPGWASPFVALFAEVGRVVGVTADGGVVEGRHAADDQATIVDGPVRGF